MGEFSVRPNRPKTFARKPTIPQKVTTVSIYAKGPPSHSHVLALGGLVDVGGVHRADLAAVGVDHRIAIVPVGHVLLMPYQLIGRLSL